MRAKTKGNVTTAKQVTPHWWLPQLDTPIGRVELDTYTRDHVNVRRAGWLELYDKYAKPSFNLRVVKGRNVPPHLDKRGQRALYLTPHIDALGLTRAADGSWKLATTYRDRRDREIAQMLADAVTAWEAAGGLERNDLGRRLIAFHEDWHAGPMPLVFLPEALTQRADKLSAEVAAGLFDFNDAGHARTVATKVAERLRQIVAEIPKMELELREAYTPSTEREIAA